MFEPAAVLDRLNDEQRRAATHRSGPLLVLAGAGTGKTGTLVARAAWLRGQGIPASRILLLTFTRRAADDMLARVAAAHELAAAGQADGQGRAESAGRAQPADRAEPAGRAEPARAEPADRAEPANRAKHADRSASAVSGSGDRICGGTFHAIAHGIIRAHAESFSLPPAFSVIDPGDVTDLLDTLRESHGLVGTERRAPRAAVCADIYSRCVSTGIALADLVRASFPWCTDFTGQLAGLFRGYLAHKRAHGLVDFDDLLLLWRAALADPRAGPVLRGMFDAVLVDEYQDVNAIQADIVRLLQPDGNGLTCVGDDAQAIYGFRGADPAHLRALGSSYAGLTVTRLARNYRSRQQVLELANVVRPQSAGLELVLAADRGNGQPPLLVRCHDEATQAREICVRVLDAHEGGLRLQDQAVLVRAAHHSDVLELELTARRIPFVKYGGLRFTEAAHVKDFLAAARVVANPADDIAWFRLLRLHEGIGPQYARRIIGALGVTEPGPFDRWPAGAAIVPQRFRSALSATIGALTDAAALETTAERAGAILAALGDPLRARYPDAAVRIADLQRLADAAASRPSLHDALVELALDPPISASDFAGRPGLDDDFLVISTIHSAKGLEWPVVHLPHLVDGAVPSDMALASRSGLAEERRLFYVAVTRARDQLYLYAPLRMHHHRTARDDRHSYAPLTRFLDPAALARCEVTDAAPARPALPAIASLAQTIDRALEPLWAAD